MVYIYEQIKKAFDKSTAYGRKNKVAFLIFRHCVLRNDEKSNTPDNVSICFVGWCVFILDFVCFFRPHA